MSDYPMLISNKLHSFRNFHVPNNDVYGVVGKMKYLSYKQQYFYRQVEWHSD